RQPRPHGSNTSRRSPAPEPHVSSLEHALLRIGRVIGKPPGWERLVRSLAPPRRFAGAPLRQKRMEDGYLFPVDAGTLVGWNVHFFGSYEPEVRDQMRRRLTPGDVAVDVGANVGWHTLLMATLVGPSGRVYAFEPNASTRERLVRAVEANQLVNVVIDPRAVSDRPGAAAFEAPPAGHVWDGTGRLGNGAAPGTPRVDRVTLDAFVAEAGIGRLSLVKIDVEGWELPVLRGARGVLDALRPAILFEYDPAYIQRSGGAREDLTACLTDARYELFLLRPRRIPLRVEALGDRGGNFLALPRQIDVERDGAAALCATRSGPSRRLRRRIWRAGTARWPV